VPTSSCASSVEARALDDALFNRALQCRLFDELAARRVDETQAWLARAEPAVVEQMFGLSGQRQVQADVIRRRAQLVECQQLGAQRRGNLRRNERVVRDDAHPERAGPLGDLLADPSETREAQRLSAELVAEEAFLFPASSFHRLIGGGNEARQCEHQRECVLGDADAVGAGRIDDQNAAGAGRSDVDVVDAGTGARDDSQLRRSGEQRRRDLRRAADHQCVGVGEVCGQRCGRTP
jgi:hypothetical protein